jgi:thiol:disulfide interchange protein
LSRGNYIIFCFFIHLQYEVDLRTAITSNDNREEKEMAKTKSSQEYETLVQNATKPVVLEFGADW